MAEEEKLPDNKTTGDEGEIEDIEELRQSLAEEKEKAKEYLANWQRSQADFLNYKKRTEQEKNEAVKLANSMLITSLLGIIDDLERAFIALPPQLMEFSWIDGVRLIYNKLKALLEGQGLAEIEAKGEPFDPNLHEAVMTQEGKEGIVIDEVQKGYKLEGKVIRPSKVVVGKGKEEEETEQKDQKEE